MKLLLLIFLLSCAAPSAAAQEKCVLEMKNAPAVFGLHLGMSPEEVQNVFGRGLKIKIKKDGERVFFQNFIKKPAPNSLLGTRAIYLRFFDRRLYQIEIFHENRSEWQTLGDFVRDLSLKFNLPASLWENSPGKSELQCADFSVVADQILNPRVEITDETIRARIAELKKVEK